MKYTFIYLIIFIFYGLTIHGQSLRGIVLDKSTQEPVSYAIVALVNNGEKNPFNSMRTDEKGRFNFQNLEKKNFTILVTLLGYEDYSQEVNLKGETTELQIQLISKATKIQEVNVEATRARVQVNGDTIEYDAKAYKVNKDANVEDLVRKMPGVTKESGTIKAYGEEVKKVLVDGEEFFGEDANIALKNLPAETVDKVEIYDAKSDRENFTGFGSGNTTKTINLKTKKGMNKGQFGKAYGGYGTNNRYNVGGNYNYYDGSQRFSILGMSNNINNLNFSSSELVGALTGSSNSGNQAMQRGRSFGMSVSGNSGRNFGGPLSNFTVSNQNGVNQANSLGFNYNDKWGPEKRVKVTASYFTNRTDNTTITETQRSTQLPDKTNLNANENYQSNSTSFNNKINTRLDAGLDSMNSILWTNNAEISSNNSNSNSLTNNYFNEGTSSQKINNSIVSNSNTVNYASNFLYKMKTKKLGRTFSYNSTINLYNQKGISTQTVINENTNNQTKSVLDYTIDQWTTTFTNILTWTEPSGKRAQWLFNYSPSISTKTNTTEVNSNQIKSDLLSGVFNNNLFYNIGGISYRIQFEKVKLMFGSSVQNIQFKANQTGANPSQFTKNFFGFLPYLQLNNKTKNMLNWRLNYNTAMNVPSVSDMQPIVDVSNPLSIYKGNENLKNDYNHNIFFHFMKPDIVKGRFLIFVSNISLTLDNISNFSYTAQSDTVIDQVRLAKGIQYSKKVNLDNAVSAFAYGGYTFPIKPIKCNLTLNGSYNFGSTPSMVNFDINRTNSNVFSFGVMLASNISSDIDFYINYNPKYNLNTFSLSNVPNNNFWVQTANAVLKLTLWKHLVWNNELNYNYNSQIDPALNQHVVLYGSSLAYKFLKDKLEAKISVFDIFNQNKNISRTVTNTTITDSRTNAMNRYGLFTLTYNFKQFTGQDPDKKSGHMQMMRPHKDE